MLRSRERYHVLLDHLLEGCQIIGFDWRYLYVNDIVAMHARKKKSELLGYNVMEVYPGIEKITMFKKLQECMKTRKEEFMVNEFEYPDGSRAWFELSIQPVPEGLIIMSADISEHQKILE